ncbi:hypothetical protein OHA72_48130 [Dactylosporangium sp. NBC_01737]|uniref:hypothetical protein n=1 Tax=Dactylosporangium sp. NBC_01737 TaxID=2975959 RepID=UPI002E0F9357|nr:hypothetical protein OHA72_48130 [Dactylosporangium sp. NBC_01737]
MQWELFGFGLAFVVTGVALATNVGGVVTRCVTMPSDLAASVSRFRQVPADRERDVVRTARLVGILAAVAGLAMTVSVLWR